jgi:hypothetical protein
MAEGWKYLLVRASDMEFIGELRKASGRNLNVDNNKSGTTDFGYLTNAPNAGSIYPWKTAVVAQRDDEWFWSGLVTDRTSTLSTSKMQVSVLGWFERLMHINIQVKVTFNDEDAGVIVGKLLDIARAQDPTLPIKIGAIEMTQKRTLTCDVDQPIGQLIQQLVDVESGFDWYIDPRTRELNIVERRGQDRLDCKWFYLPDDLNPSASNLKDVIEKVDGMTVVNDLNAHGKFTSRRAIDAQSQLDYGLFQEPGSLLDVVDANILDAFANAEIVYRKDPRTTYKIFPKSPIGGGVPRIFDDFDIGDITYMTVRKDFVQLIDQATRIFGAAIQIEDGSGAETISDLETSAS